jgi:5-methylcytosine-specific restriction endonuclease McrA
MGRGRRETGRRERQQGGRRGPPREPAPPRRSRRILEIIATDATFEIVDARGQPVWQGQCLHCKGRLRIALDGRPISRVTIEHIVPRAHGGTDELDNLGLACARCNHEKGRRHDPRGPADPTAAAVIVRLLARRRARWRSASE